MNYGGIVPTRGARAAGPGLTDPAQAFGAKHRLELRQDNTMRVSESQKKKSRGRKILEIPCVPAMEEPFLKINSKGKVAARPGGGLREREEVTSNILRYFQPGVMPVDFPKHEGLMLGGELRLDWS